MSEDTEKKEALAAQSEPTTEAVKSDESKKEGTATASVEKTAEQPSGADLLKSEVGEIKIRKAKGSKNIASGICKILATFNNTKVCFTDLQGNVISWSSAGKCNFRGSRKSTAYAAQIVTQDAGRTAISHGMKEVFIKVEGPGMGRDSAIRAVQAIGLMINGILDVTPIPHNGCRAKNPRSV